MKIALAILVSVLMSGCFTKEVIKHDIIVPPTPKFPIELYKEHKPIKLDISSDGDNIIIKKQEFIKFVESYTELRTNYNNLREDIKSFQTKESFE